jgi:hypothetical protein
MSVRNNESISSQSNPDLTLQKNVRNRVKAGVKASGSVKPGSLFGLAAAALCFVIAGISVKAIFLKMSPSESKLLNPPPADIITQSPGALTKARGEDGTNRIETALKSGTHQNTVRLSNGVLYFAEVKEKGDKKFFFDPEKTYKENWTTERIIEYLGRDPRPCHVPEDLAGNEQNPQKIIFYNDGTVAYDNFHFGYNQITEADIRFEARTLSLEVSKERLPKADCFYIADNEKVSNINGHEVSVGYCVMTYGPYDENKNPSGYYDVYFADFIHEGTGYRIRASNLSQEEFIDILLSIVK